MRYKCIKKQPTWENVKVGEFYEGEVIDGLLKIDNGSYYTKEGFFVAAEPEWLPNPMTGECPVPDGNDVEIMLKNNERNRDDDPEGWNWGAIGDGAITHYRDWTAFNQQQAKPAPSQQPAHEFLEKALGHMQDRATTYDSAKGERSMGKTVAMFNAMYEQELTEEQGWAFMCLLKLVRTSQGDFRADNYEDLAAYAGLMGESASQRGG